MPTRTKKAIVRPQDDFLASPTLVVMETTNMVANASMREWNGAGTPQHGLHYKTMALITSECGLICSLIIKWP